jgi:Mg/Co/Ni transporter MgtE
MVYEDDRNDDVYVEREGTGVGTILGIILAIVVVLAIIWFFFLGGMGNGTPTTNNGGTDTTNQTQVQPVDPGNGNDTTYP